MKLENAQTMTYFVMFCTTLTRQAVGFVPSLPPTSRLGAVKKLKAHIVYNVKNKQNIMRSSSSSSSSLMMAQQRQYNNMVPLRRTTAREMSSSTILSQEEEAATTASAEILNGDNGSSDISVIRRTTAIVMSMAIKRVIPGAVRVGSLGPNWINDGFFCDFTHQINDDAGENGEDIRHRIKREMDEIISSGTPITSESISLEEAQQMAGDDKILLQRLNDAMTMTKEDDSSLSSISICRVGDDWWDICENNSDSSSQSLFLGDTSQLDPNALALTSVCWPTNNEDEDGESDESFLPVQRFVATAWETESDLLEYKTVADKAQVTVKKFGELVSWGLGSLNELEYTCPCCTSIEQLESFGLGPTTRPGARGGMTQMLPLRTDKTRLTEESGPKIEDASARPSHRLASKFVPTKNPEWLRERETTYDAIRKRREAELDAKPKIPIEVTLPDGTVLGLDHNLTSWTSTPYDVAMCISEGLSNIAIVARVGHTSRVGQTDKDAVVPGDGIQYNYGSEDDDKNNNSKKEKGELWDLTRPLEGNCNIEILKFDSDDDAGKAVFWHSSAHILGQSLEHNYGALLTIGPPIAGGFYYDAYMGDGEGLSESQLGEIDDEFRKSVKRKEKFERLVVTKEEALDLFSYSPFKTALIAAKVPDGTRTTVYRNGDLIDLCMGPHVPHTGKIKAFKMLRCSAAQWLGDAKNDQLQRVYGVSYPNKKLLKTHIANLEAAKERDHRRLGVQQKLFMFHKLSPGSAFFLPHGTIVYNTLSEFIRTQYRKRGYSEVITPNIFNLKLWEQSGHAKHYKDDMFTFEVEGEEWGMKPMNCPAHCLMFASTTRSYRELPMRIADFGVLHRNEQSGALGGLTRVRRFQQDDAHIFCQEDQIQEEVVECLEFMKFVYQTFGMSYKLELSTRPAKALGEKVLWDRAETALAAAMDQFVGEGNWKENPGDGAFYGPKIDIKVMDAMDRIHQCATIQLDFQLPIRFDLRYRKKGGVNGENQSDVNGNVHANGDATNGAVTVETTVNGVNGDKEFDEGSVEVLPPDFARPVMVHRAMLGSVERMFAVLLEHYGGKWPFWLSPRQALVVPVGMSFVPYGNRVKDRLLAAGFHVDIDDSTKSLKKKVRDGQIAQYNYIFVVGETEETNDSVNVRNRNNEQEGEKKMDDVIAEFKNLCETYQ